MSNWNNINTNFTVYQIIPSAPINAAFNDVMANFNLLPDPLPSGSTTKGFTEPCSVGVPTDASHAVRADGIQEAKMCSVSGTADAIVLTSAIPKASYTDGMVIKFKPTANNTGAVTVNIDGLGTAPLKDADGNDLDANDLVAGNYAEFTYNGSSFLSSNMLPGDRAYIDSKASAAATSAANAATSEADAKQWAIGAPSEPAEHSAKYWAESVDPLSIPRKRGYKDNFWHERYDGDLNNITENSCYNSSSTCSNSPMAGRWGFVTTFIHIYGNWRTQFWVGMNYDKTYQRHFDGNNWTPWVEIITTDNFNANLNAAGDARYQRKADTNLDLQNQHVIQYSSGSSVISFGRYDRACNLAGTHLNIKAYDGTDYHSLSFEYVSSSSSCLRADANENCDLGIPGAPFRDIYLTNSPTVTSDMRRKKWSYLCNFGWILKIKPVEYKWKDDPGGIRYGMLAQQVYDVMPDKSADLVHKPEDASKENWAIQPDQLIAPMLKMIQSLEKRVRELEDNK